MKTMLMAAVAAVLLMSGSAAFAQQGQGQGQGPGTGKRAAQHAAMMKAMDADGNGSVSLEEFLNAPRGNSKQSADTIKQRRTAHFKQLDRNGDGVLSLDELPTKRP
jgi:opacity protein-like surface antigen